MREKNSETEKKLLFVEKLLIERDNNQYHAHRKAKKLEKEKNELDNRIKEMENEIKDRGIFYENEIGRNK